MKITQNNFEGILIIEPLVHQDERGYFYECWQHSRYLAAGIKEKFVQDNCSWSKKNVLRGMHYQRQHPLGQLIWVTKGEIFDVAIDLRPNSTTFKQWLTINLDAKTQKQIYLPPGFAHGFCVVSKYAMVHYKCTDYYYPQDECGLLWNDLPIEWPIKYPIISKKDQNFLTMTEIIQQDKLPSL